MAKITWKQVVSQREKTMTDREIESLRTSAGSAGDEKQVKLCDKALNGQKKARLACAEVLADAELNRRG
jgi:hypothetical protein